MSDAFLYKAFVIEYDASQKYFKVDGRKAEVQYRNGEFSTSAQPNAKKNTLLKLARFFIDNSPEGIQCDRLKQDHLGILRHGKKAWDEWRIRQPEVRPLLYGVNLVEENVVIDLREFDFSNAVLCNVNFENADLSRANFHQATLAKAKLCGAILDEANFCRADLYETDFSEANLNGANLQGAQLAKTILNGADLIGCKVYGMSAWDLKLKDTKQDNLVVRYRDINEEGDAGDNAETQITVDSLQVAQFIYLILSNKNIGNVVDTITAKTVLILGRFTPERKIILDAMRQELRKRYYVPILFDFDRPKNLDLTETVSLLARMARFVVADLTDAKSIPQELDVIVPALPSVPVQPLLLEGSGEYSMFEHFRRYPWVLPMHVYTSPERLIADLGERVINPAEAKAEEQRGVAAVR